MRQAIVTKYLGPTNFRGSRVKATAEAGSLIIEWNHSKNVEENHLAAAMALAMKWGWAGNWVGGALPGRGYGFVLADSPGFNIGREPLKPGQPVSLVFAR